MADLIRIKNAFLKELKLASNGEKSSLSYIKHVLPHKTLIQTGLAEAVIIGGTNFEFATIRINENQNYEILRHTKGVLPVLDTAEALISVFERNHNPDAQAVSVNFAFPLSPAIGTRNELDGILIKGTKEHALEGLIGHPVGEFLRENVYKKELPITVANDTVCLSLSGDGTENAAMILGTGFNMSLNLKNSVVNLEAGNFDKFTPDPIIAEIDKNSEDPGIHLIEKATAGKYLVEIFNIKSKLKNFKIQPLSNTEELSNLAANDRGEAGGLAKEILIQSAEKIAAITAGLYEYLGNPDKFEIITEGSLFWKGFKYHENVRKHLMRFGINDKAIFKQVKNSSLKGAVNLILG